MTYPKSRTGGPGVAGAVAVLFALFVLAPPPAVGKACEEVSPDGETTVSVQVDAPLPGDEVRAYDPDCPATVTVRGAASTEGLPPLFDVYLIIDSSGSTGACSGGDVDGDGEIGTGQGQNVCSDSGDTILEAEVESARQFVDSLSSDNSRVSVLDFSDPLFGNVTTRQRLTTDFSLVRRALARISLDGPGGATDYGAALQEMLDGHDQDHDPARTQVALFLSDGFPTSPTPPYDRADGDDNCFGGLDVCQGLQRADDSAARGITIHTFAVGRDAASEILRKISSRTGGDHFDIEVPSDILDVLPGTSLVGIEEVVARNLTTGEEQSLEPSPDGRYSVDLGLVEGLNEIEVTARADDDDGTTVVCDTDIRRTCITFGCPDDRQVACEGPDGTWIGGLAAEASDPGVDITNDSPYDATPEIGDEDASGTYPLGDTVVGFGFSDEEAGARSCSARVTVTDEAPPELDCPEPSVEAAGEGCAARLELGAQAEDLCAGSEGVTVTDDGPSDDIYPLGTTLVTFTAEDPAGNRATCQTTVTVDDVTPPEITCPDDRVEEVGSASCDARIALEAEADDNCREQTGLTVEDDAPASFDLGTTTVTFTARDGAGGEATCRTLVEVRDVVPPEITCPADQRLETGEGDETCEVAFDPDADATDLCDPEVEVTDDAPALFPLGDTRVTHTARDDSGNEASCGETVTVVDTTDPVLDCPEDAVLQTGPDQQDCRVPYDPEASGDDNCDGAVAVEDDAPSLFPMGTTVVTFTARDEAGNSASCSQGVTVEDATAPRLECPPDRVLETGPGDDDCLVPYTPEARAEDNCDASVRIENDAPPLFPLGTTVVTFTARDEAGNEASCTQEVTVVDTTPPSIECPADERLETGPGDDDCLVPFDPPVEARDNCDGLVQAHGDGPGVYGLGTTTVTWSAEDAAGNEASCSHDVTVVDTTPPVLDCPPDALLETGPDDEDCLVPFDPVATAQDNCDPDVEVTDNAPPLFPLGGTRVDFLARDDSGNEAACSEDVVVVDTTPPRITFPRGRESCLWPPDHRFACFESSDQFEVSDNCDADLRPTLACLPGTDGASANQPVDSTGDGAFAPDCVVALDAAYGYCVRSERKGDSEDHGPRLYRIGLTATDASGNTASDALTVRVDHDGRDGGECYPASPSASYGAEDGTLPAEYPQFPLPGSPGLSKREK